MRENASVARAFSGAAPRYESVACVQRDVADWTAVLWPRDVGTAIDLGCGPGVLVPRLSAERWIQLDLSEAMARLAGRYAPTVCADASRLPFASGTFDGVASSMCLQWLPLESALREWRRVARPGAVLVVSTPLAGSLPELARAYEAVGHASPLLAMPSIRSLNATLDAAGWRTEQFSERDFVRHGTPTELLRQITRIGAATPSLDPATTRRLLRAYPCSPGCEARSTYRVARLRAVAVTGSRR